MASRSEPIATSKKRRMPAEGERDQKRQRTRKLMQAESKKASRRPKTSGYPDKRQTQRLGNSELSHISYWAAKKKWPKTFFQEDIMQRLLAKKKSAGSLARKMSMSSLPGASDELPREQKSAPYRNTNYPDYLSTEVSNFKSYLEDHELGPSDSSKRLLDRLHNNPQRHPEPTVFRADTFNKILHRLKGKNESRIIRDISLLIVPSAEGFSVEGARHLDHIIESVNEGWNNCHTITKTRPQPDSAVGLARSAFTEDQLEKLRPFLGDPSFYSYFRATYYMLFPFLAQEVKAGTMALETADNQNAHSMTIAVRGVVELFKLVGREKELHREIVAFSVSHDNVSVRLYAYYPFIDGEKVTIWRRTAAHFILDVDTMWKSWTFIRNVYDIFYPMHLRRLRSAVDDISPDLAFSLNSGATDPLSSEPAPRAESSGSTSVPSERVRENRQNEGSPARGSRTSTTSTSVQNDGKSPERKKKRTDQVERGGSSRR